MNAKEQHITSLNQRLSWRSAKIAVTISLVIGAIFALLQIYTDVNNEKERISEFSHSTLISISGQAARAAYRLDEIVANDITEGLLSFKGVKEARIYDDFGNVLSLSNKAHYYKDITIVDRLLGNTLIASSKELQLKSGGVVGRLEIKILPAAFSPGFSDRTYGVIFAGFMKGLFLALILTLAFHHLISRRILNAAEKFKINDNVELKISRAHDEIDHFLQTVSHWKAEVIASKTQENRHRDWFQLAAKSAGMGFWEWDLKTGKLSWDENMHEMYCLPKKDFQGVYNDWSQCVHPEDKDNIEQNISDFLDGKSEFNTEFRIITSAEKSIKYLSADATILRDDDGAPLSIVGINRDITSRKMLEEELLNSKKLEAIGKLTGGIAHDFNNSFQTISGHLELLKEGGLSETIEKKYLSAISRATHKSSDLVKSLLAFSCKQTLFPESINLFQFFSSMEAEIRQTLGSHIEYDFQCQNDLVHILVDKRNFKEAILSLVQNVSEAIDKKGKMSIQIVLREKFNAANDITEFVEILIRDSGKGISNDHIDKIFDPFFTTKDFAEGGGLGLSMAYGFIKQSDGEMTVSSIMGKETTFKLILPINDIKQKIISLHKPFQEPVQLSGYSRPK